MKKLILLALAAVMMTGCEETKEPNRIDRKVDVYNVDAFEVDSCEYITLGHGIAHKGNCKYCEQRRKAEIREIVELLKDK